MRQLFSAVMLVALLALGTARGAQEVPGALVVGSDLCTPSGAQPAKATAAEKAAPSRPQRAFSWPRRAASASKPAAPARAPSSACSLGTRICGPVAGVEAKCRATPGCKAFSYEARPGGGGCGYLKSAAGPRRAERGWTTYVVG